MCTTDSLSQVTEQAQHTVHVPEIFCLCILEIFPDAQNLNISLDQSGFFFFVVNADTRCFSLQQWKKCIFHWTGAEEWDWQEYGFTKKRNVSAHS